MCLDEVYVFDGVVRVVLLKSEFTNGGFSSSLDDHNGALNAFRAWVPKDVYCLSKWFMLVNSLGLSRRY